jgi:hypothetical protein
MVLHRPVELPVVIGTLEFLPVSLNSSTKLRGASLGAILAQKSENVIGPDIGSKVAKGVTVSSGVSIGGIDLQFVRLAHVVHFC